jgi:hypothetical protein
VSRSFQAIADGVEVSHALHVDRLGGGGGQVSQVADHEGTVALAVELFSGYCFVHHVHFTNVVDVGGL